MGRGNPVHKNSICQLYGTVYVYAREKHLNDFIYGVLYTTTSLSNEAKNFAEVCGITTFDNFTLERFHSVKCKCTNNGKKLFYLPFDNEYFDISSELYVLRKENERRFASLEADISTLKKDTAELKHDTATFKNNVAELKHEVKELRRDVSEIKGDLKAINASLGAAQNRFNWGLIILGLFVALIQLLK